MEQKIIEYFKKNKLPKPITIKLVGSWAMGDQVYAVSCKILKIKRFAVYCIEGEIHSVRERGR
ncbi:MAG: hypothetical protein WBI17_09820 [Clostridiaceae bacterium]